MLMRALEVGVVATVGSINVALSVVALVVLSPYLYNQAEKHNIGL